MNIIQQPDALSFSYNIRDFRISSTEAVSFVLKKGATELVAQTYEPGQDGYVTIKVRDIVHAQLAFFLKNISTVYEQPGIVADFTAVIDSTEVAFRVIRGGVDNFADTAANFLTENWLTWQPQEKSVTYSSPEFLTYYAVVACTCKLKAYYTDESGTVTSEETITVATLTAGKAYTMPMQYAAVSALLSSKLPAFYDIWVENGSGSRLSYIQRYYAGNMKSEQEDWILFENSLGGIDTFRAYGVTDFTGEHTHNIAEIDEVNEEYRVDTERKYQKNTGYLNKRERIWLLDFFPSAHKMIYTSGALRTIVVTESDVTYKDKELPSSYTFTYKFAHAKPLLNLTRASAPAEVLNIAIPDLGNFTVPPRLVELDSLPLTEGALFPVQSPYDEEWGTTTPYLIAEFIAPKIAELLGVENYQKINLIKENDTTTVAADDNTFSAKRILKELSSIDIPIDISGKLDKSIFNDFFSKENVGTEESPVWAIKANYGLYTDYFLSAKDANQGSGSGEGATSLGELNNVGSWADEIPTVDRIMIQIAGSTHWSSKALSDIVGLDTTALQGYLDSNNYAKKSDIPSLSGYATQDWVTGRGYLTSSALNGYATQSWVINQGYATSSALSIVSSKVDNFLEGADTDGIINKWKELEAFLSGQTQSNTLADLLSVKADKSTVTDLQSAVNNKLDIAYFKRVFGVLDASGNELPGNDMTTIVDSLKLKVGTWTDEYFSLKGQNPGTGGSVSLALSQLADISLSSPGNGESLVYNSSLAKWVNGAAGLSKVTVKLGNVSYDSVEGTVNLPAYPTSLPASDVYSWAKQSSKPSYVFFEIGSKPTTLGGYGITDAVNKSGDTVTGRLDVTGILTATGLFAMSGQDFSIRGKRALVGAEDQLHINYAGDWSSIQSYGIWYNTDTINAPRFNATGTGRDNGFRWTDDIFGGDGDVARIYLINPTGGESTELTLEVQNDADDVVNILTPSATGLWHNRNVVLDANNYSGYINGRSWEISAQHLLINGVTCNSNWYGAGQGGQPTWLWGSNDGTNMYVYNPSNFSVNYAGSAGNADTLDGVHNGNVTANYLNVGTQQYIDLSSWDSNTWYPCVLYNPPHNNSPIRISFTNNLSSNVPSWATHSSGFTFDCCFEFMGSGWGATESYLRMFTYHERFVNGAICYGLYINSDRSFVALYLRGGGNYSYRTSNGASFTPYSSTVNLGDSTSPANVGPTTSRINNVWEQEANSRFGSSHRSTYADALSSSRSLWGQFFRGDGDVNGTLTINADYAFTLYGSSESTIHFILSGQDAYIGQGAWATGASSITLGNNSNGGKYAQFNPNGLYLHQGWLRTYGATGLYNQDYNGGIYMSDSEYLRSYNNKPFVASRHHAATQNGAYNWSNIFRTDSSFTTGGYDYVDHNTVQTMMSWGNVINNVGYITRYSIASHRSNSGWGDMILSVGNSDAGDSGHALTLNGGGQAYWSGSMNITNEIYAGVGIWTDGYLSGKGQNTTSDGRLKRIISRANLSIEAIAKAPDIVFSWKDGSGTDVGSIAQYWRKVLPASVKELNNHLTFNYGGAAIVGLISVARKVVNHEDRIKALEKENMELKQTISNLERRLYA